MVHVKIVPMSLDDIKLMAEQMRPMDILEYEAMSNGLPPEIGLEFVWKTSEKAKAVYLDGELLCCWGRSKETVISDECNPWMLATPLIETKEAKILFIRHSKRILADLIKGFSRSWNLVYEENDLAIRWLKWAGFEFIGDPIMFSGYKFLPFEFKKV